MLRTVLNALLVMILAGCVARLPGPYAPGALEARDPVAAQHLTHRAADLMETDPDEAERLLREALTADLFNGPAHNNLGVTLLADGRYYEAAGEFEWARKLMPGHPDPRMNLALTLERAGRIDDALAGYDAALEVYPGHMPTIQALCRCQLRHGRSDARTVDLLEEIVMRGESERWRAWARDQLTRLSS